MKQRITLCSALAVLLFSLVSVPNVFGVILSVENATVNTALSSTVSIDITVDDPTEIAGAAFTVNYDTSSLKLIAIESRFFDTFLNQFTALPGAGEPFVDAVDGKVYVPISIGPETINVPVEENSGDAVYNQPLIDGIGLPQGTMVVGARVLSGELVNNTIFTLTFDFSAATPGSSYSVEIVPTSLAAAKRGKKNGGEAMPILIGALQPTPGQELADPSVFPILPVDLIEPGAIDILGDMGGPELVENPTSPDFNGDRMADILVRRSDNGQLWMNEMNGTVVAGNSLVGDLDSVWNVESLSDFNGDGNDDILLRDSSNGQLWMNEMDGPVIHASSLIADMDPVWQVVAVADFNGDMKTDILFRNSASGQLWLYEMDGPAVTSSSLVADMDTVWNVTAAADFDGDSKTDILMRNSVSGELWLYVLDGATIVTSSSVASFGLLWDVEAVEDFSGDFKADILLRNRWSGVIRLCEMDGEEVVSDSRVVRMRSVWEIKAVKDFNGDDKADILLRNSRTGEGKVYLMDGARIIDIGVVIGRRTGGWTLEEANDYNGDGKADLLLMEKRSGELWVHILDGTSVVESSYVTTLDRAWDIVKPAN